MPVPRLPYLQSTPNDIIIWHTSSLGDYHCRQIWRLEGGETDGWNLWDVYDFDIVAVHWHNNNASTEIEMRFSGSYWYHGRYESPQD